MAGLLQYERPDCLEFEGNQGHLRRSRAAGDCMYEPAPSLFMQPKAPPSQHHASMLLQIWADGKQLYLGGFDKEEQVRVHSRRQCCQALAVVTAGVAFPYRKVQGGPEVAWFCGGCIRVQQPDAARWACILPLRHALA